MLQVEIPQNESTTDDQFKAINAQENLIEQRLNSKCQLPNR